MPTDQEIPSRPPTEAAREDVEAFSIGATDREESLAVKRLLDSQPELWHEAAEYAASATLLSAAVPRQAPPPALKERIMAAAQATRPAAPTLRALPRASVPAAKANGTKGLLVWVSTAAAVVLLGLNVFWVVQFNQMREAERAAEAADANFDMAVALLTDTSSKRIELMDEEGSMLAMVVWMPDHSEALMVTHALPALGGGQTYQLWVIGEKGPMSAGVFDTDGDGAHTMMFENPMDWESVGAVGISVEPPGGSDAPTSTPLAVGAMS